MAMPNVLRDGSEQSAQPPFSNAQLNETATHREILNIYQHARPETRMFYDMGRDIDGLEEENWVIRWLLWHVSGIEITATRTGGMARPTEPDLPAAASTRIAKFMRL